MITGGIEVKCKQAGWNDDFLLRVLQIGMWLATTAVYINKW